MTTAFIIISILALVLGFYLFTKYLFTETRKVNNNIFIIQKDFDQATASYTLLWIVIFVVVLYQIDLENINYISLFIVTETLALWGIYYSGCHYFLKIINNLESVKKFNIKIFKSILIASAAWTAVSSYVSTRKVSNSLNSSFLFILKIITTFATLYFPINDMYQYIIDEIKKEQKNKKEKMRFDHYNYF